MEHNYQENICLVKWKKCLEIKKDGRLCLELRNLNLCSRSLLYGWLRGYRTLLYKWHWRCNIEDGALWRGVVLLSMLFLIILRRKVAQSPHEYGYCRSI